MVDCERFFPASCFNLYLILLHVCEPFYTSGSQHNCTATHTIGMNEFVELIQCESDNFTSMRYLKFFFRRLYNSNIYFTHILHSNLCQTAKFRSAISNFGKVMLCCARSPRQFLHFAFITTHKLWRFNNKWRVKARKSIR